MTLCFVAYAYSAYFNDRPITATELGKIYYRTVEWDLYMFMHMRIYIYTIYIYIYIYNIYIYIYIYNN